MKETGNKTTKATRAGLFGPLYTDNTPTNLGGAKVGGPTQCPPVPDPLKFAPFDLHTPAKGAKREVNPPPYAEINAKPR